jgi:probable O-glycosylation ligase (exosortase A-associated)
MRVIAILICFATGTLLSLRHVVYASCFFIWHDIFRPIDFAYRSGFLDAFPSAHLVTATLLVSVLLCKWHRRWNPVCTLLCIMIGWMYVSAFFAVNKKIAFDTAIFATKFLIPLVIISMSLTTRWAQNMFLYTMAASVGVWSMQTGLYLVFTGPNDNISIPGGQMTDRNDFVAGIIAALPLIGYVFATYGWKYRRAVRFIAGAAFALSIVAFIFSGSRGGIIGASACFLFYMFATGRFGKKLIIGMVVIAIAVAFMPSFVLERMSTIDMSADVQTESSAAARLNLLKCGVEMTLDYPITGVGGRNFKHMVMHYGHPTPHDPHNIWLKASAEYGFPMLALFILTAWYLLRRLGRERKLAKARGDRETEKLAIALACSIVGFLATTTFLSQFLSEYFWGLCALSGAFIASQEYRRRHPELDTDQLEQVFDDTAAPIGAGQ